MDITGAYSFYLNKITIASNFTEQYKKLHFIYSRPLVIKYKTQMKDILEIFRERNDVKKEEIEHVEKVLTNLRRVENELYLKEKEELKKLNIREENKNPVSTVTTINPNVHQRSKVNYLPLSVHSCDEGSETEDRYGFNLKSRTSFMSL